MSIELAPPSEELARKIMTRVSDAESLTGLQMHRTRGSVPAYMYSFETAANFMHIDSYEDLVETKSNAHIGYIDVEALKAWVGGVFGDSELADAIAQATEGVTAYVNMVEPVRGLLQQRLAQCREVVAAAEAAANPSTAG